MCSCVTPQFSVFVWSKQHRKQQHNNKKLLKYILYNLMRPAGIRLTFWETCLPSLLSRCVPVVVVPGKWSAGACCSAEEEISWNLYCLRGNTLVTEEPLHWRIHISSTVQLDIQYLYTQWENTNYKPSKNVYCLKKYTISPVIYTTVL